MVLQKGEWELPLKYSQFIQHSRYCKGTHRDRKQWLLGGGVGEKWEGGIAQRDLWGDGHVYYLDCGNDFTGVYLCQNIKLYDLNIYIGTYF